MNMTKVTNSLLKRYVTPNAVNVAAILENKLTLKSRKRGVRVGLPCYEKPFGKGIFKVNEIHHGCFWESRDEECKHQTSILGVDVVRNLPDPEQHDQSESN